MIKKLQKKIDLARFAFNIVATSMIILGFSFFYSIEFANGHLMPVVFMTCGSIFLIGGGWIATVVNA